MNPFVFNKFLKQQQQYEKTLTLSMHKQAKIQRKVNDIGFSERCCMFVKKGRVCVCYTYTESKREECKSPKKGGKF